MPESHESHDVFLGEFFWSPAAKDRDDPYYSHNEWTPDRDGDFLATFYLLMTGIPGARAVTTAQLPSLSESICHVVFWWNR